MKYAMIPICTREDESGNLHIRRVLISYLFKKHSRDNPMVYYCGTKIIATDDYFTKETSTHKYEFKNGWYTLKAVSEDNPNKTLYELKPDIYVKRKYHGFDKPYLHYPTVIEFKSHSRDYAIDKFCCREELR